MRTEFCDARAIGKASRSSQPLKRCARTGWAFTSGWRSEEHTSELQSRSDLVCRLLLEKKKKHTCRSTCLAKTNIQLQSRSTLFTNVVTSVSTMNTIYIISLLVHEHLAKPISTRRKVH